MRQHAFYTVLPTLYFSFVFLLFVGSLFVSRIYHFIRISHLISTGHSVFPSYDLAMNDASLRQGMFVTFLGHMQGPVFVGRILSKIVSKSSAGFLSSI